MPYWLPQAILKRAFSDTASDLQHYCVYDYVYKFKCGIRHIERIERKQMTNTRIIDVLTFLLVLGFEAITYYTLKGWDEA